MSTTHMGYGFVVGYFVWLVVSHLFPGHSFAIWGIYCVVAGLVGGAMPDLDRWESIGFSHRKTLHYPIGYGVLASALALGLFLNSPYSFWLILSSCFFAGAWAHALMDILDGPWEVDKGVYEHASNRWIKALDLIPYAREREWMVQSASSVLAIGISPNLAPSILVPWLPGWAVALGSFIAVLLVSIGYEFRGPVPMRRAMEARFLLQRRQARTKDEKESYDPSIS